MTQYAVTNEVKPIKGITTYVAPVREPTDHLPLLNLDDLPRNTFWLTLGRACTLRRDYGSQTEAAYVAWLVNRLPVTMIDGAGNIHVDTRTEPAHRSMFTSHTDSVHSSGGVNPVHVDGKFWRAGTGAALGADDGAGNAVMAYMIEMGVPGYFVFFRGEECGGIGSKWLAKNMPELFEDIDRAVAFDRAGYYDIITYQSGGRCCSDAFAEALADKLSTDTSWYTACPNGVYTDTAEFIRLIPECTNISVGYKNQHGDHEEQDVEFLWGLAKICVSVQWDNLPTVRDPKVRESLYSAYADYDYMDADWYKDYKVADGVYHGTKLSEPNILDDADAEIADAIEDAMTHGNKIWIMDLIADVVSPEDPGFALKNMNAGRLDPETLEMGLGMIHDGWTGDQVLQELFDFCRST